MGLESTTYIDGLVSTNPLGTDAKSQGDDHIRLLKSTIKATFPNITGAVTPTHTELNYVDGVTSAIQTQIDSKGAITGQAWTGAHTFASTVGITGAVSTGALTVTGGGSFTGDVTGVTASPGSNDTKFATTAFATQLAFQASLPAQTGETGKFLTTDGASASWGSISNLARALSSSASVASGDRYKHHVLTSAGTLSLLASVDGFIFWVRNSGTGVWVIDPNGAETIDGAATIYVAPGDAFAVIGDGSNWRTFGRSLDWVDITSTSPSGSDTAIAFTAIPEFRELMVVFESVGATANCPFAVGDATPTYTTATTLVPASNALNGAIWLPGARRSLGGLFVGMTASPTVGVGGAWTATGGIKAIRTSIASGTFSGSGVIRLLGR